MIDLRGGNVPEQLQRRIGVWYINSYDKGVATKGGIDALAIVKGFND